MKSVAVRNVSKIYHLNKGGNNFKEFLSEHISHLFDAGSNGADNFYALKNVAFELDKGDVLGIIGDNGAGKSTLLKIISGVSPPSEGEVAIDGRISSILEIGTGFHMELTGRENIFLSGSILGMSNSQIKSQYENIVRFSGLDNFINVPIKKYSSGMYLRLAFSVLAHLSTDIILLDEIIYVGDAEFRLKSYNKIKDLAREGKTIIVVSHDLASISDLCTKCLLLANGEVKLFGKSGEIVREYLDESLQKFINTSNEERRQKEMREEMDALQQKIQEKDRVIREKEDVLNSSSESASKMMTELNKLKSEAEELYRIREAIRNNAKTSAESSSFVPERIWQDELTAPGNEMVRLKRVSITTPDSSKSIIRKNDEIILELEYWKYVEEPVCIGLTVSYNFSQLAMVTSSSYGQETGLQNSGQGLFKSACHIGKNLLNHGLFSFSFFFLNNEGDQIFRLHNAVFLKIDPLPEHYEKHNYNVNLIAPFMPVFKWS